MMRSYTTEDFIERAIKVHGNTYEYSKTIYLGNKVKVYITCKVHGDFLQKPDNHLYGYGCIECGKLKCATSRTSDTATFIDKAISVHGGTYNYEEVCYMHKNTKIVIICKVHGEFLQTPDNHLAGHGCDECARTTNRISNRKHGNSGKPTLVYYVYFPEYNLWKIGCTNKSIEERFRYDNTSVEILYSRLYQQSTHAYLVEGYLLKETIGAKYREQNILKGGNSELRTEPVVDIIHLIDIAETIIHQ